MSAATETRLVKRITDRLNLIVRIVHEEYAMGSEKIYLFRGGPVMLWIRQEKAVLNIVVSNLVVALGELMRRYGPRELMKTGMLNYGMLAAMFELTIPGNEDE